MKKKSINFRKLTIATLWLMASIGLLLVLIAAIKRTNVSTCKGVSIKISGAGKYLFLDKDDVWAILGGGSRSFRGKPVDAVDLRLLEEKIRVNSWVKNAELFFDQDRVLQVRISEREPVARIFTGSGISYYMDSTGKYLPLAPGKPPVKLPVFTGMPEKLKPKLANDSSLLNQVKSISAALHADSFWMAQISQVALTPVGNFEMIPLIGNHTILFGDGNNSENKFRRLGIFYNRVLTKTGFDYYSSINVQFDKQVIGVRGTSISTSVDKKIVWRNFADTSLAVSTPSVSQSERKTDSNPTPVLINSERKPKAVMRKTLNTNNPKYN
jgi:cell division protein FtsQ